MILFFGGGGLGNQIFQYVFVKSNQKKGERIVALGFEDVLDVFKINDVINFNKKNKWVREIFLRIITPFFIFLSNNKIISSVKVGKENVLGQYTRELNSCNKTTGLIKNITYIYPGYFQSEVFFEKKDTKCLMLKNPYFKKAQAFLKRAPQGKHLVFLHIRQGDYKKYRVFGKSALLPLSYFKDCIQWFQENQPNVFFVFLSDEPEFIKDEFSYIENKLISENAEMGVDLAIMTLCNSAILSPSSFGWWGSYLMKNREVIFSPKYWLGFNSKKEYHLNSTPSYSIEIEINN